MRKSEIEKSRKHENTVIAESEVDVVEQTVATAREV